MDLTTAILQNGELKVFLAILALILLITIVFIFKLNSEKKGRKINDNSILIQSFETSEDGIMVLSSRKKLMYANLAMMKILDLNRTDIHQALSEKYQIKIKKQWHTITSQLDSIKSDSKEKIQSYQQTELDIGDETTLPVHLYITMSDKEGQGEWSYVVRVHDLRKEHARKASENIHKITKLPNQSQAIKDLNELYAKTHLSDNKLALILMEIDNFSKLRSLLGYEQANRIIVQLANYFTSLEDKYNVRIYHTYPNNFLFVMTDIQDIQLVHSFIDEIQFQLKSFYKMKDVYLHMTASVGVSIYPDSGNTINLLDYAYKALAEAESQGHGYRHIHMPEKKKFAFDELTLYNEMHSALEKGQFEVYYQPIVQSKDEELIGAEALIRWIHPAHGMIPPDAFIPIMERTGFIIELGKYILDEVLKQQRRWEQFKFKKIYVSINVSMIEVEAGGFVDHVKEKLQEFRVDPDLIVFEVTEGSAMISEKHTINEFQELRKLGVGIALDDFGTGYTSFSYLKKFPATALKIDKSLVDYLLTKRDDQKIVQAMVELAHNLDLKVVVEGIENKKMMELLNTYHCDYYQGYYFSKPLPLFEFQKFLRQEQLY